MDDWDHGSTRDVDHVIGAFYVIRRALFEAMRGFDAGRFFVYLEDLDLSLRVRRAGWRSVFLAEEGAPARVFHQGGGTSEQVKAHRLSYALHSRIRYGYKHFGWPAATVLLLATLLAEPAARLGLALSRRSWKEAGETVVGYALLWRALLRPSAAAEAAPVPAARYRRRRARNAA
jgi:GT2 family glycosyltransferase